jgi:hypothetical protein
MPWGHRHREQEEAYVVVVGGSGRANLDGEAIELEAWDVVRVAPSGMRAVPSVPAVAARGCRPS